MLLVLLAFPSLIAQAQERRPRFINPPALTKPNGYTHVVVTSDGRTAHIAGQVALDSAGRVVGAGDFKAQADKVFANLRVALASVDASFEDVLKTTTSWLRWRCWPGPSSCSKSRRSSSWSRRRSATPADC
jgi:hypothetical protein